MKKIKKTQDQVLSAWHFWSLLMSWVFGIGASYIVGEAPLITALISEAVFFAYLTYAEFRYTL